VGEGTVAVTPVQAIHGLGGVGKTQLAARYARERRDDYDVVWWLRAEQPATVRADLAALGGRLGLPEASGSDEQPAVDATLGWLEHNGRWLVVFDNAPGPDAIAGLLVDGGRGGHVLITSRTHADWCAVGARPVALDVWPRPEAIAFLRGRSSAENPDVLDAVADALGDLPLALEQAVAYASTHAITLSAYLDRLRDRAPRLFAVGRPPGYEHTVATVWQLAFEQVSKHPVAQLVLAVCAFLGPEGIPRELLETLANGSGISAEDLDDAIAVLLGYALLTPSVEGSFAMHRLVGQLAREHADTATRRSAARLAVAMLTALWPEQPWEHEHWATCQRLLPHALTAAQHIQQLDAQDALTAVLLAQVGHYQQARAQCQPAQQQLTRALAILEAMYGPEHPSVAITLTNLGNVQTQLGEFAQAHDTFKRALTIFESAYGPEHPQVAITLTNLGNVQTQLGEIAQARDILTRALTIKETGPEDPEIAITLANLGTVQTELGELAQAHDTFKLALTITEAAYGPEHPQVARLLTSLGVVQQLLGELAQARSAFTRALTITEAAYGPEHPEIAITLANLGNVQRQLGELEQARDLQQRALAIEEAVYGPEHAQVVRTLMHLGNTLRDLGELERARDLQQRALGIKTAVYGDDHYDVAATRSELARTLRALGTSDR
jgi:Tfp pilus assembly protein PilF